MKFLPILILAAVALSSCSSSKKAATPPLISQRMASRLSKPDMNRRSIYDKDMQASLSNKPNSTDWLGRKKFASKKFAGDKTFSHTPKFKTSEFSGSDSKSKLGFQKFGQSDKTPAYADQSFATKQSIFDKKSARDDGKIFSGAGDTFKTSAYRDALKSQQKNDRPKIVELEENRSKPAYSEDQVRSLMGRQ